MQGFIILAIIGTEKISVTEVDRQMKCQMDGRMDGKKGKLIYRTLLLAGAIITPDLTILYWLKKMH